MSSRLSLLLLSTALLSGCGGGVVIGGTIGCDDQMAALTGRLGFPEREEQRIQGGLHIHTFFYVRTGVAIAFTWGDDLSCSEREFRIGP
jgi:hypothetical protein